MSSQPGSDLSALPGLPALPQAGDEALAIETAVRTAVLSIMKVFLDLSDNRAQRYQLKLAEMERENLQLKLKLKTAELQLHAGQHGNCSGESYEISADLTFSPETSRSLNLNLNLSPVMHNEEEQTAAVEAPEAVVEEAVASSLEASDLKLFKEEPSYEDTFWIKNEMTEEGCVEAVDFCGYHVLTDDFSGDPHVQQQIMPVQRCGACSSLNHTSHEDDDAPTASSLKRKRLASSERVRQYRARIRADPEKYHMLKEKDRMRYLSRRKTIADLPEPMKNLKRKAWREASKRHRARKRSTFLPTQHNQYMTNTFSC